MSELFDRFRCALHRLGSGCPASLQRVPGFIAGGEPAAAGGLGECPGDQGEIWVIVSPCGKMGRERCPGFQALRQILLQSEVEKDLPVGPQEQGCP